MEERGQYIRTERGKELERFEGREEGTLSTPLHQPISVPFIGIHMETPSMFQRFHMNRGKFVTVGSGGGSGVSILGGWN